MAQRNAKPAQSPRTVPAAHSGGEAILVVDDDAELRVLVRRSLAGTGFAVLEAASGTAALRMADENPPALIILDVLMPDMDGLEVLRRLRRCPGTAGIPVLMLTSLNDEHTVREGFDLGCEDYLSKPFSMPQLAARVKACLARS